MKTPYFLLLFFLLYIIIGKYAFYTILNAISRIESFYSFHFKAFGFIMILALYCVLAVFELIKFLRYLFYEVFLNVETDLFIVKNVLRNFQSVFTKSTRNQEEVII